MSIENPQIIEHEGFHELFPHLEQYALTKEQQEKFLVLHVHNEKQEAVDKLTHDQLLEKLCVPIAQHAKEKEGVKKEVEKSAVPRKFVFSKSFVTNGIDFVPVIGSLKMIMEGVQGEQYGTHNNITGWGRVFHTGSGVVFLALDVTGVGAIASEIGKGALKVGERVIIKNLEHQTMEKTAHVASRAVLEKEIGQLASRGEERVVRQNKVGENTRS